MGQPGSTDLEVSRRQCSPTLRPALALIGAGAGNRPFPSGPTTAGVQHISERKRRTATQRDNYNQMVRWLARGSRKAKPPRRCRNKGLGLRSVPAQSAIFQDPKLSPTALLVAGS